MEFLKAYTEMCDSLIACNQPDNQDFYEAVIQTFFGGSKVPELTGLNTGKYALNEFYEKALDEDNIAEIKIQAVDLSKALSIYSEYLEGMTRFINDIKNVNINEGEDLSKYSDKFAIANEKDTQTIESLFGGSLNNKVEMTIESAISDVDFLVDFLPKMKEMYNNCKITSEAVSDVEEGNKKELISNCLSLMYNSVDNFCKSAIKNALVTYESMVDVLTPEVISESKSNVDFKLVY